MNRHTSDAIDTLPLFDAPAPSGTGAATGEAVTKASAPRAVVQATCPCCLDGGRSLDNLIGLLRQGPHLVWREHFITTGGRSCIPCRASAVAICVAPPRVAVEAAVCKHRPGATS